MSKGKSGKYRRRRIIRLGAFQDDLCFFCDQPLDYLDPTQIYQDDGENQDGNWASFDHYHPRSEGGSGSIENIVIAHRSCNTALGHEFKDMDDKLRALNIRRGFIGEGDDTQLKLSGNLRPDNWCKPTPALVTLCDVANDIPGIEGRKIRRKITKRINTHLDLLKSISCVSSKILQHEIITVLSEHRNKQHPVAFSSPIDTLLDNVLQTMTKIALLD